MLKGFIFWEHPRGSWQYDLMVTLILAFVFLAPYWVSFRDRPTRALSHHTPVVVTPEGEGRLVFRVEADTIPDGDEAAVRHRLQQVIEPIAGEVEILRWEAERDEKGHIVAYRAWVRRL